MIQNDYRNDKKLWFPQKKSTFKISGSNRTLATRPRLAYRLTPNCLQIQQEIELERIFISNCQAHM